MTDGRGFGGRGWALVVLAAAVVALSGCGGEQSTLDTHSRPSRDIATLFWWMAGVAGVVVLVSVGLLLLAYRLRRRPGLTSSQAADRTTTAAVVLFGVLLPLIALVTIFVVANFTVAGVTDEPAEGSTAMTVEVTGHQWFWEVRYPGHAAVTANEIHIPAATRVNAVLRSDDVIHSFWVPQLNRKADMLPGHPNRILLYADRPGVYRGQCAEFCGTQHARMAMRVVADPPARFRAWLANESRPRPTPVTPQQRAGERAFMAGSCASCHAIRGTSAHGTIGPDLTHLAGRATLAALTIPNTPAQLRRWIRDPQAVKRGNIMPATALSDAQLNALVAYLDGLR